MAPVFHGNNVISQIALGNTDIAEAYLGNTLVYQKAPSGPGIDDPTDLANLWAWFDFTDQSVLYQDTDLTIPVASNGDQVRGMAGKGPYGRNIVAVGSSPDIAWDAANGQISISAFSDIRMEGTLLSDMPGVGSDHAVYIASNQPIPGGSQDGTCMLGGFNTGNFAGLSAPTSSLSAYGGLFAEAEVTVIKSGVETPVLITRRDVHEAVIAQGPLIIKAVNANYADFADAFKYLNSDIRRCAFGTFTHIVDCNAPLSTSDEADLIAWLEARLPT